MKAINLFILTLITLCVWSCANQTSPTGGPKDEEPPQLISSDPEQGELNFKGDKIILEFNEFIKTDNPKEQIIITPRLDQEYTFKYRKNRVIIEFDEPLKDSTTYSLNFREGIKDITEGNPTDNLVLAFSTGSYLDSLTVSGNISDLMTNKPAKDITVSLYDSQDTLDVFNGPPIYLTKTDEEGNYQFNNIKNGLYKIYAINDKNKNLMLDSKTEAHGFRSALIPLDTSLTEINMPIQSMDVRPFELQSARQSGTTFNIKYNKYIDEYTIVRADSTGSIFSNISASDPNTIELYNNFSQDSLEVIVTATDTTDSTIINNVYAKFEETNRRPSEFKAENQLEPILSINPKFKSTFNFTKPIAQVNNDSIFIFLDSAHIVFLQEENFTWNKHRTELEINYSIDPELFQVEDTKNVTASDLYSKQSGTMQSDSSKKEKQPDPRPFFRSAQGTFISIENDSSSNVQANLSFNKPDQLATVIVKIETEATSFIVQLLDTQNKVLQERANEKNFEFKYVKPGDHKIRVLVDSNKNGIWEAGNITKDDEPEPVIFYKSSEDKEEFPLRANWVYGPCEVSF
ncbi:Ig-like domain-containing domain [Fulvivirga sediminis]|uniref:Ig-like domain-containing protein n=1 Tax=Fulvivirga sediminis TaxID=2803949 RepID=A0A937JYR6_9BACT|nr:Ig-like domain-containing domain [Fulvivirga sediminis]MBL3654535.1 Ig-like domain-containing protein [Fulvivirga sediminis]